MSGNPYDPTDHLDEEDFPPIIRDIIERNEAPERIARLEAELAEAKKREAAWQEAGYYASEKLRLTEIQLASALAREKALLKSHDVLIQAYTDGWPHVQIQRVGLIINEVDAALAANPPPDLVVMSRKRAEALEVLARAAEAESDGAGSRILDALAALDESNETANGTKSER